MDDAARVGAHERAGDLCQDPGRLGELERAALDASGERFAFVAGHRDEVMALPFADFVDGADVRVVERTRCAGLAQQARLGVAAAQLVGADELERHLAVERLVLGQVDDAHAPLAELGQHAIVRDSLADHGVAASSGSWGWSRATASATRTEQAALLGERATSPRGRARPRDGAYDGGDQQQDQQAFAGRDQGGGHDGRNAPALGAGQRTHPRPPSSCHTGSRLKRFSHAPARAIAPRREA